jgi:hypothetical protein
VNAAFIKTVLQKKWKHKGAVYQLFIDFKDVGKEILCYVFTVFGIPMDLGSKYKYVEMKHMVQSK